MSAKKPLWGIILVLVVGTGTWWWLERNTRPEPVPVSSGPASLLPAPTVSPSPDNSIPLLAGSTTEPTVENLATSAPTEDPADPARRGLATISDLLSEPGDDHVRTAKKLAALVQADWLPLAEREEALAHTMNLAAGNDAEVLAPLVRNSALPEPLTETILAEALNRPLSYQADLYLLALGRNPPPSPEMRARIRDHLRFLTDGEDLGDNPAAWGPSVTKQKASWDK